MIETSRGRIVMLVDNDVDRDSRVQKAAKSAAERGWDVVLLGQKRLGPRTEWTLGGSRVKLIKVQSPLRHRRHLLRRAPLRAPLSYGRPVLARYRKQLIRAQKADLQIKRVISQAKDAGPVSAQLSRAWFFLRRARLAIFGRWVVLRARKTIELDDRRKAMTSHLDRFTTAFWCKAMGKRSWRRLDPHLWDWELAFGPEIDDLKPDIIHANDFRMLGIGARATLRARAAGRDTKLVWDAHEFLPGIKPWNSHPRWHISQCAQEREYAPIADTVVTVSEGLGDLLIQEHGLTTRPTVVLNAPDVASIDGPLTSPDIRTACGLEPGVPLLVYSGAAAPQRGLDIMIEGLPQMPEAHIALVVPKHDSDYMLALLARAKELGVSDRVHLVDYVPVQEIVPSLATADIGVHPPHHWPNHEISLGTKFFEYSHARLPIVVSDVKSMSEKVIETGQGEVFIAEDLESYVRAVRAVLADPQRYRSVYDTSDVLEDWTWESQADILDRVYSELKPEASQ